MSIFFYFLKSTYITIMIIHREKESVCECVQESQRYREKKHEWNFSFCKQKNKQTDYRINIVCTESVSLHHSTQIWSWSEKKSSRFFTLNAENDDKHCHCRKTNSNFSSFIIFFFLKPQKYETSDTLPKLYFYFCFEATICMHVYVCWMMVCMISINIYPSLFLALTEQEKNWFNHRYE